MFDKNKTCCFTGHRPEKMPNSGKEASTEIIQLKYFLHDSIENAVRIGYTDFICGMSRGFDLWAAEEVLKIRKDHALRLTCAIPFENQKTRWAQSWQERYHSVLTTADYVFCLAQEFSPDCYHKRNRFMADRSSLLICYFDGTAGGTEYTVRYAQKQGLTVQNLADHQLSLF